MYYDYTVKIPKSKAGISRKTIKGVTYIYYAYHREYDPVKKYTVPKNTTIGKAVSDNPELMHPNAKFFEYFDDVDIPEMPERDAERSSCLRYGAYLVIRQIIKDYGLDEMLESVMPGKSKLFLDLAAYTIICENNASQYYPEYAYNHPLMTEGMKIYSDSTVGRMLQSITKDESINFLSQWNERYGSEERIHISYDSTNKNCQAGDIVLAEIGHAKEKTGKPIVNFAVAYDMDNSIPLYYEDYSGSIVDVTQLQMMVSKAKDYNYKNICFVLDRGYFSEANIHYMDDNGFDFIIMMKGNKDLVNRLVLQAKGTFEEDYKYSIPEHHASGITIKMKLFPGDKKERYVHIYFKDRKKFAEREKLENKLMLMEETFKKHEGKKYEFPLGFEKYYSPSYSPSDKTKFLCATKKDNVISDEIKLMGYYAIITSYETTAKEALNEYKSRDVSEKVFRADKSFLGNNCYRVQGDDALHAKIFVEFIALIIRNKLYTQLKKHATSSGTKRNYMNVVAALKELEKIELIKQPGGLYKLDHAVTATQKEILKAFDLTATNVRDKAKSVNQELQLL